MPFVPKSGTEGAKTGEKRVLRSRIGDEGHAAAARTEFFTTFVEQKKIAMETRKHLAAEKKRCNSHNCAQAVVCTYCDLVGLPEQTALDIAGAYGTGMGNMEGTCGALVGAGMIIGLATKDRNESRAKMKQMMTKFQQRNGATQCKLLKGIGTGVVLRDCPDCVADASEFLEELL